MAATVQVLPQHEVARAKANHVRIVRGHIKRRIRAGVTDWRDVLDVPEVAQMRVYELIGAVPQLGPLRVGRALDDLRITELKRVGELTERQRTALINSPRLPPRRA